MKDMIIKLIMIAVALSLTGCISAHDKARLSRELGISSTSLMGQEIDEMNARPMPIGQSISFARSPEQIQAEIDKKNLAIRELEERERQKKAEEEYAISKKKRLNNTNYSGKPSQKVFSKALAECKEQAQYADSSYLAKKKRSIKYQQSSAVGKMKMLNDAKLTSLEQIPIAIKMCECRYDSMYNQMIEGGENPEPWTEAMYLFQRMYSLEGNKSIMTHGENISLVPYAELHRDLNRTAVNQCK